MPQPHGHQPPTMRTPPTRVEPSPPPPAPGPPTRNYLADELRHILRNHDAGPRPLVRERLLALIEQVERYATAPVEVDASTELTAHFGLEPEQECRADALTAAARLLAPALTGLSPTRAEANASTIARVWIGLAQHGEAWISTGGVCPCSTVDDPECPLHGVGGRP